MTEVCPRVEAVLREWSQTWRPSRWTPFSAQHPVLASYARAISGLELRGGESCLLIAPGCLTAALMLAQLAGRIRCCVPPDQDRHAWRQAVAEADAANVEILDTDPSIGGPDHAPYHAILVASPVPYLIPAWLDQLALDARLVAPLGPSGNRTWQAHQCTDDGVNRLDDLGPVVGDANNNTHN